MSSSLESTAELPFIDVDLGLTDAIRFSYSRPDDPLLKKALICAIEKITGQSFLRRSYLDWSAQRQRQENIFAAGIRVLDIDLNFDAAALNNIPARGPLLVVANHPFGVADGLALGDLVTRIRPDSKIMTHSLLCQPPEAARYLLPVDFGGTPKARQNSARTRKEAVDWLKQGHCVVLFPAGGVATRQKPLSGPALDLPWHSFVGKLAAVPGVRVQPMFFEGQNSTLFHLASHTFYALRAALLFRETLRKFGGQMTVRIGAPMAGADLPHDQGRQAVADHLRKVTFALDEKAKASATPYVWPKHVTF